MTNKNTMHLLTISLILSTGCNVEERFSRYPSVSVPEYELEDYLMDLSDPDSELVYNAVCNLGEDADDFSKILCAKDADPTSDKYQRSADVYNAVCGTLEAKDPLVVAASLRFLQIFAKNYEPKAELLEIVCEVESSHPQVQFEQVTLIKNLVCEKSSDLPEPLLRRLLNSPSWIVSRTAYSLISLSGGSLRKELVRRYQTTEDEREQLILLAALSIQLLEPEEIRMLEEDMLAAQSPRLRIATGMTLVSAVNAPETTQWLSNHYPQFNAEERKMIFSRSEDIELKCRFLSHGYVPEVGKLKLWAKGLLNNEKPDRKAELLRFDKALQTNPQVAARWQSLKDEAIQEHQRRDALREDMTPLSEEFLDNTKKMLAKHNTSASEQKRILENIGKMLKPYMKE
jgi:hypothetical protein